MSDLREKILAAVGSDLRVIESALADNLNPQINLVAQVAGHLLFAGGKRLRPLMMILANRLCGRSDSKAADYAVIFEYLHAATLIHDDVVDGGDLRRGQQVAHHIWDTPTAVLTGDFLLARSLTLAARTGLPEVIRVIAGITEQMSQGEIRQLDHKGDVDLDETVYLDVIRCKTAVLFQGACRVGGLIAGAPDPQLEALDDYGLHLGMAFQMADDLLDYIQDCTHMGKSPGADLREGKLTLPVIYTLEQCAEQDRDWLKTVIRGGEFSPTVFERIRVLLAQAGGIEYTRRRAAAHITQAKESLNRFTPSKDRDILHDIADYALERTT